MGRIKTQLTKRITIDLLREHGDDFKNDFEENKKQVSRYTDVSSKKLRNVIAGYATRLVRKRMTEE